MTPVRRIFTWVFKVQDLQFLGLVGYLSNSVRDVITINVIVTGRIILFQIVCQFLGHNCLL